MRLQHLGGCADAQIRQLMDFMGIFMHGLANLINDGRLDDDSDDQISNMLEHAYRAFVRQVALPPSPPDLQED